MENELHYRTMDADCHWSDPYGDYPPQFPPDPLKGDGMPRANCIECGGFRTMVACPGAACTECGAVY